LLLYFSLKKNIPIDEKITISATISIVLILGVLIVFLMKKIYRTKEALRLANDSLETKVMERTAALHQSESRYRTIFEHSGTAMVISDPDMRISLANSKFVNICGYEKHEIEKNKSWLEFLDEKCRHNINFQGPDSDGSSYGQHLECRFSDKHEQSKDVLVSFAPIPETGGYVVSVADISQLKEAERKVYHHAFYDTLTGLPNRALFMEHLAMAVKRTKRRENYHFAILYLDIDRFKIINDGLGHHVGDALLIAFANRLKESLRDIDVLARFGGDEFAILLEDIEDDDFALKVARRLQKLLGLPFNIEEHEIFAPASFGIVLKTRAYERPADILRDADTATYHAKDMGRGQLRVFDQKLHQRALQLLQIETDLRKAIEKDQFELHYQPIVDMVSGRINGFEALIRWLHPHKGLLKPDVFIPVAEETGLIIPIGRWVLQKACSDLMHWQKCMHKPQTLFISVNISSKQFLRPNLIEDIQEILDSCGLSPTQLKLEITETALMENTDENLQLIQRLKDIGIQIVIDDFGTGYSSMSYLHRFPIDTLKVDRSFVSNLGKEIDGNKNIVEAIITLAHKLNIDVVAEGVETASQYAVLSDMKCQSAQGFLFSEPLATNAMLKLIEDIDYCGKIHPGRPFNLAQFEALRPSSS
jgi:diguanylate cyclase (GGDEF)-like protein/PAS domain S-box-containing protein